MTIAYQLWTFWGWGRKKTFSVGLNANGCIGIKAQKKLQAFEDEIAGKKHRRWTNPN